MKVKKRIISVILTISMLIISVVPALAADISVSQFLSMIMINLP